MEIVKAFNSNSLHTDIIIKGTYENPLFRASDIGLILDMSSIRSVIREYNSNEKVVLPITTPGGIQNVSFLTAKGLYKILFKSTKPIAETFQNWVYNVIEEIRLTGEYKLKQQLEEAQTRLQQSETQLQQAQETIQKLEQENEKITDVNAPSIYIYNIDTRLSKPELKIGYTINVQNRIRPYKQVCKHGRLEFTYQIYNKNIKVFEHFIHNLLSDYLIKDEVFSIDIEEAKVILLRMINTVNVLKLQNSSERQLKLKQLLEYENNIINNQQTNISSSSISTQTDFDTIKVEPINVFIDDNTSINNKFNQYIDECCIIRSDVEISAADIEGQFRIWSKIVKKDVFLALSNYLKTRFKYIRLREQNKNQIIYGYSGIMLKETKYIKSLIDSDEQNFIYHSCIFSPGGKVLYKDLCEEYINWKKSLNKVYQDNDNDILKKYLINTNYVIYTTIWTPNGNGQGFYGLSLKNQLLNVKRTSSTGKRVEKRLLENNELIGTWETIAKAAVSEHICAAKMSRSIKQKTIFNNEYYYQTQ
jgi:prophage antirepressor-like protein